MHQVVLTGERALQLIGLNDAQKRWVLKNPSHLFALNALFATYPDALVIQCHPPAETIMASMCSLAQHTTDGWSTTFVGETIGQDSLETWSRGLELFNAERKKHDSAQFYDMDYFDFIANPVRELEAIYRHFGIDFTDEARAAVAKADANREFDVLADGVQARHRVTGRLTLGASRPRRPPDASSKQHDHRTLTPAAHAPAASRSAS